MDCAGELELGGLRLHCQLGEHVGLHSAQGEKLTSNEQGETQRVLFKVSWAEERAGSESQEAAPQILEWLKVA
jgi:hypothetical protein